MKRLHDLELGLGVDEVLAAGADLHLHALHNGDHNDDTFQVEKILMIMMMTFTWAGLVTREQLPAAQSPSKHWKPLPV